MLPRFTLEIDGGPVTEVAHKAQTIQEAWMSENFDRLRRAHRDRTWDLDGKEGEPICLNCAVTKKPTPIAISV